MNLRVDKISHTSFLPFPMESTTSEYWYYYTFVALVYVAIATPTTCSKLKLPASWPSSSTQINVTENASSYFVTFLSGKHDNIIYYPLCLCSLILKRKFNIQMITPRTGTLSKWIHKLIYSVAWCKKYLVTWIIVSLLYKNLMQSL